jgi:hypothetical protein
LLGRQSSLGREIQNEHVGSFTESIEITTVAKMLVEPAECHKCSTNYDYCFWPMGNEVKTIKFKSVTTDMRKEFRTNGMPLYIKNDRDGLQVV